jgi:uncharacterized 2Fe-2S/4Fe-4S cluster protein (DUF4445 family)
MDVLSRIALAGSRPESTGEMQRAVVELLDAMTEDLCRDAGATPSSVRAVAAAGNCAMLHLLLGVSPAPLGAFPFRPVFTQSRVLTAAELGLKAAGSARVHCLPSASAFIGADIVAGVYASGLERRKGSVLFIDIGTNGEIVLALENRENGENQENQGKKLISCSCAAGPALEGMNISCGTRAVPGAVEDVHIDAETGFARLKIIGNPDSGEAPGGVPAGICGCGILASVREMLRAGLLRTDGSLVEKEELPRERRNLAALYAAEAKRSGDEKSAGAVRLAENVVVTQKDIRQVQLAKGALLSGTQALLERAGLDAENLDKVLVAGRFGEHIPAGSLTRCGILPAGLDGKIEYLGNTSKAGARAVLTSPRALAEMEALARGIEYLDLAALPGYGDLFIRCLEFPPPHF